MTTRHLARDCWLTVPELHKRCRDKGDCMGPGCRVNNLLDIGRAYSQRGHVSFEGIDKIRRFLGNG